MMKVDAFKRFAAQIAPTVSLLLLARAHAELERERVDAYVRPIFDRYAFRYGSIMRPVEKIGQPLDSPDDLYLVDGGPALTAFYAECDTAHRQHGFTGPEGHSPALIAENTALKAEHALIDMAAPLFGIQRDRLYGEHAKTFLDLLIGAAVKTGRVTNPLKRRQPRTSAESQHYIDTGRRPRA